VKEAAGEDTEVTEAMEAMEATEAMVDTEAMEATAARVAAGAGAANRSIAERLLGPFLKGLVDEYFWTTAAAWIFSQMFWKVQ
jgi:hypothetical protein